MRLKIAQEGVATKDGRLIRPMGLTWEREPVPVTLADSSGKIVGTADKIRREPDGAITADITAEGIKGLYPQIACDQIIEGNPDPILMSLKNLRLRCVAFGNSPVWDDLGVGV